MPAIELTLTDAERRLIESHRAEGIRAEQARGAELRSVHHACVDAARTAIKGVIEARGLRSFMPGHDVAIGVLAALSSAPEPGV